VRVSSTARQRDPYARSQGERETRDGRRPHWLPWAVIMPASTAHDSTRLEEAVDAISPLRLPGKSRGTTAQVVREATPRPGLRLPPASQPVSAPGGIAR